jgi:regulation of enolase protein 1 (concanavalin A-like superfamily)
MPLRWLRQPQSWSVPDGASLLVGAGPRTDWFVDPQRSAEPKLNAPALLGGAGGDFLLSARVTVDFAGTYDAGVLVVSESDDVWAKLCFEYSPQHEPMVVSVVTRGVSDDCNSFVVDVGLASHRAGRIGVRLPRLDRRQQLELHPPLCARVRTRAVDRVRRAIAAGRRLCCHVRADRLRGLAARRSAQRRVRINCSSV